MSHLWSGRFEGDPDAALFAFGASFRFDRRLFEDDVSGSMAWAEALARAGVLSADDAAAIASGLREIARRGSDPAFFDTPAARQDETAGEASRRIWRARFSLDIEPAGPIHALVSFSGGTTAVRMWAERPLTAARLRADTPALSQALREAALEPGDIVVGEGAPPSPAPHAGHFWDRAL